jgi:hypothetical protein
MPAAHGAKLAIACLILFPLARSRPTSPALEAIAPGREVFAVDVYPAIGAKIMSVLQEKRRRI